MVFAKETDVGENEEDKTLVSAFYFIQHSGLTGSDDHSLMCARVCLITSTSLTHKPFINHKFMQHGFRPKVWLTVILYEIQYKQWENTESFATLSVYDSIFFFDVPIHWSKRCFICVFCHDKCINHD